MTITNEILRELTAAEENNAYSFLVIEPCDESTETVCNYLMSEYPNMKEPAFDGKRIIIADHKIIDFEELIRTATEITSTISEVVGKEPESKKHYGRYTDDRNTLFEFDSKKDLKKWIDYKDSFSKLHGINKDNASYKRVPASKKEVKRIFKDSYECGYDTITGDKVITKI